MSEERIALIWSLIVSMWSAGAIVGGIIAGVLAEKFGRYLTNMPYNLCMCMYILYLSVANS